MILLVGGAMPPFDTIFFNSVLDMERVVYLFTAFRSHWKDARGDYLAVCRMLRVS